jgi:phosphoenolpyruvate synthase/pyruvate phosphate dikinase
MKKIPEYFNNLNQLATRPMTVQREEWAGNGFYNIAKMRCVGVPFEKGTRVFYVENDNLKKACISESKKVTTNLGWKKHLELYEEGKKDYEIVEKMINEVDIEKEKLSSVYKKWLEFTSKWIVFGFFPYALEAGIDPEFRKVINEKYPEKAEEIILAVSSPSQLNTYQEMRLEICDYVLGVKDVDLNKLSEKYGWYNEYSFVELLYDEKFFAEEINKLNKEQALEEKSKILHDIKENKERYNKIIEEINDEKAKLLAEIIHTYTFLRTDRIDVYKKGQAKIRKVYSLISGLLTEKTGQEWSKFLVVNLLDKEIIAFLDDGVIPDKDEIEKRAKGEYIYVFDENGAQTIMDEKLILEAQKIIYKEVKQEIKGQIAHKGKVSGRVAMVMGKNDLHKVKEGDILVSRITMPDYTPAMKIASAFVTEEGGITSHAAIVARELKKPCIVGTGNCTKVLKDGNIVEVDADKGIVKIIK